jgi:hypothetical protein
MRANDGQLYLYLSIDTRAAVKRGEARGGAVATPLSAELLAQLTEPERDLLGDHVATSPDRGATHLRVNADTIDAIREALEAKRKEVEAREAKARKVQEMLAGDMAQYIEFDPEAAPGRRYSIADGVLWSLPCEVQAKARAERERRNQADWDSAVDAAEGPDVVDGKLSETLARLGSFCPYCHVGWAEHLHSPRFAAARYEIKEAKKDAEKRAKAEEQAERQAWIRKHGSERLNRLLTEGIEHMAVYRDERLATERPGWRWESDVEGGWREPRNPPMEALELLDAARMTLPEEGRGNAELVYWVFEGDRPPCDACDGEGATAWRGYAVVDTFKGQTIVFGFGGPADV